MECLRTPTYGMLRLCIPSNFVVFPVLFSYGKRGDLWRGPSPMRDASRSFATGCPVVCVCVEARVRLPCCVIQCPRIPTCGLVPDVFLAGSGGSDAMSKRNIGHGTETLVKLLHLRRKCGGGPHPWHHCCRCRWFHWTSLEQGHTAGQPECVRKGVVKAMARKDMRPHGSANMYAEHGQACESSPRNWLDGSSVIQREAAGTPARCRGPIPNTRQAGRPLNVHTLLLPTAWFPSRSRLIPLLFFRTCLAEEECSQLPDVNACKTLYKEVPDARLVATAQKICTTGQQHARPGGRQSVRLQCASLCKQPKKPSRTSDPSCHRCQT